jgi:hypothetical protein
MSVDALSWAKKQRAGSPAAKCVLMILADYADEHGVCWPSQETLARESEQSVDSVQRQLKALERIPLIVRNGRGLRNGKRAVTVYTLLMSAAKATSECLAPQFAAPQIAAPQTACIDTAPVRHKPSIEPSLDAADDARARQPGKSMITPKAFALSDVLIQLQRLDPHDPRSVGVPYTVQGWLTKGWRADLIQQAVEVVMARCTEPPKSLRYFEAAIAQAHAEHDRPLPVASITNTKGSGARYARSRGGGGFARNTIALTRRNASQCPDPS